jgi:hypothetical protein
MGATFARIKNWTLDQENLTDEELDAEFNNILTNLTPAGVDDYCASLAQMKLQTSPGAQGSESLATSLAGEIERLRFVINRILGETYWYDAPDIALSNVSTLLTQGLALPPSRIVSGKVRSATDAFPIFLQPHGTDATVTLKAAVTPFVAYIEGVSYTISADVTATGLSLAPSTNNTCLVNDAALTGSLTTSKYAGELGSTYPTITIDTVGSEISALVGKYAAFKVSTEYFVAYVKSATELTNARRGYFFDSSDTPITRVAINNNDTITLAKLTWVFLTTGGTLATTQNPPVWAYDQPTSPANGDYWYNLDTDVWKTYNGSSFVAANAILIGVCALDSSGCKGARSLEIYAKYDKQNSVELEKIDNNTIQSKKRVNTLHVAGTLYTWNHDFITWDMTNDKASGVSDSASTTYYVYVSENGDTYLDTERPYNRTADLLGWYHPHHNWRAVGYVANDGSSNFETPGSYGDVINPGTNLIGTEHVLDQNITQAKLQARALHASTVVAGGIGISGNCGTFVLSSGAEVALTNHSVTITTTGRPVYIGLIGESTSQSYFSVEVIPGAGTLDVWIRRDGTKIATYTMNASAATLIAFPCSVQYVDTPAAGTYTYSITGRNTTANSNAVNLRMVVYEL